MKMNKRKTKWNQNKNRNKINKVKKSKQKLEKKINKHKVSHMSVLYHRKPPQWLLLVFKILQVCFHQIINLNTKIS